MGRAALGHRPVGVGEQLAQGVPVLGRKRDHRPARARLSRHVIAHQERAEHRAVFLFLQSLEEAVLPSHHPALPHPHQHAAGVVPVARVAHDIGIARPDHLHACGLLQPLEPPERVAEVLGPLVVLALAGDEHGLADPLAHVAGPSLEEAHHVLDHAPVVFLALPADARSPAATDVVVQTRPLTPLDRDVVRAAPDRVQAADDRERAPELAHVGVGAVVARAGNVAAAGYQHPRKRITEGDGDGGIALVVLEPHVEARPVLLDEVVLEDERLRFRGNHDRLHVRDEPAEQPILGAHLQVGGEVAPHSALQTLGLADVQNLPVRVPPQVHAGAFGQGVELALKRVGNVWCCHRSCRRPVNPPSRVAVPPAGGGEPPLRPRERRDGR